VGAEQAFALDLAALPGGADVRATLQDGALDILVSDSTAVDAWTLEVAYFCPGGGVIAGAVYVDVDGDGAFGLGDGPLPGSTVAVTDAAGGLVAEAVASPEGLYKATNVPPGVYDVTATPANGAPVVSPPGGIIEVVVVPCKTLSGVDFGTEGCDDGDPCTVDGFDAATGCVNKPLVCDDGVDCTVDQCVASVGGCVSTPDDSLCADGSDCTAELCDPASGCQFDPAGVCCGNGVVEGDEECDAGASAASATCSPTCAVLPFDAPCVGLTQAAAGACAPVALATGPAACPSGDVNPLCGPGAVVATTDSELQAALSSAAQGGKVCLGAGQFGQSLPAVQVSSPVEILGLCADKTQILAPILVDVGLGNPVPSVETVIRGVSLSPKGPGQPGVVVQGSGRVTLADVRATGFDGPGITVSDSAFVSIVHAEIGGNGGIAQVRAQSVQAPALEPPLDSVCSPGEPRGGLEICDSAVGIAGEINAGDGISVELASGVRIERSTVVASGGMGVRLQASSFAKGPALRQLRVAASLQGGVLVDLPQSDLRIDGVEIEDGGLFGLATYAGEGKFRTALHNSAIFASNGYGAFFAKGEVEIWNTNVTAMDGSAVELFEPRRFDLRGAVGADAEGEPIWHNTWSSGPDAVLFITGAPDGGGKETSVVDGVRLAPHQGANGSFLYDGGVPPAPVDKSLADAPQCGSTSVSASRVASIDTRGYSYYITRSSRRVVLRDSVVAEPLVASVLDDLGVPRDIQYGVAVCEACFTIAGNRFGGPKKPAAGCPENECGPGACNTDGVASIMIREPYAGSLVDRYNYMPGEGTLDRFIVKMDLPLDCTAGPTLTPLATNPDWASILQSAFNTAYLHTVGVMEPCPCAMMPAAMAAPACGDYETPELADLACQDDSICTATACGESGECEVTPAEGVTALPACQSCVCAIAPDCCELAFDSACEEILLSSCGTCCESP
jgi:hypothetical protein